MAFARADDLCDLAKTVIETAAAVPANEIPGTEVEVVCEDDAGIDTGSMAPGKLKVYVSWEQYEDAGPASRKEDTTDYTLVFIVVEVTADAGKVARGWRKLRTAWVQKCIVDALGDARQAKRLDGAFALRLDRIAHDLEELTERKAFWCGVAITLRDIRPKAV